MWGLKREFSPLEKLRRGFVKKVWIGGNFELEDKNCSFYLASLDLMREVKRRKRVCSILSNEGDDEWLLVVFEPVENCVKLDVNLMW